MLLDAEKVERRNQLLKWAYGLYNLLLYKLYKREEGGNRPLQQVYGAAKKIERIQALRVANIKWPDQTCAAVSWCNTLDLVARR